MKEKNEKKEKVAKPKVAKPKKENTIASVVRGEYEKNKDKKASEIAEKYGFKVETVNWYLTRCRHSKKN